MCSSDPTAQGRYPHHEAAIPGIEKAATRFGQPEEREYRLDLSQETFDSWKETRGRRPGEVVFLIRRPSGGFLLHTKSFYPPGTYRLPSGGIERGEDLTAAVYREAQEETGLSVSIQSFLGILRYRFFYGAREATFASYVFLLREVTGTPVSQDSKEQISGFREAPLDELLEIAQALEELPPNRWKEWGQFRALAHRFVVEKLASHQ